MAQPIRKKRDSKVTETVGAFMEEHHGVEYTSTEIAETLGLTRGQADASLRRLFGQYENMRRPRAATYVWDSAESMPLEASNEKEFLVTVLATKPDGTLLVLRGNEDDTTVFTMTPLEF